MTVIEFQNYIFNFTNDYLCNYVSTYFGETKTRYLGMELNVNKSIFS